MIDSFLRVRKWLLRIIFWLILLVFLGIAGLCVFRQFDLAVFAGLLLLISGTQLGVFIIWINLMLHFLNKKKGQKAVGKNKEDERKTKEKERGGSN